VSALTYPRIAIPAAATTIARRLDRAGLVDTDHAATAAWLHDLALYERQVDKERCMALYVGAARTVDVDGVVTRDPDLAADAALVDCLGDLAAWSAHAAVARAMIALLDSALTAIDAIPVADLAPWVRAGGLWLRLRQGAGAVRPLPPVTPWRDWRWDMSLKAHDLDGYRRHMVVCRQRYRLLAPPGRRAVAEEHGIRDDLDILHRLYPVAERDALDERAKVLGVWTGYEGVARRRERA
jgi:hypothetical protein